MAIGGGGVVETTTARRIAKDKPYQIQEIASQAKA
jgi:hypothetical protein